jgi:hypothetical protein
MFGVRSGEALVEKTPPPGEAKADVDEWTDGKRS